MPNNCEQGVIIPLLSTDLCNGETKNSACIIHTDPITLLSLSANSTQEEINNAFVLAISSLLNRVELLETRVDDLEERILILEAE